MNSEVINIIGMASCALAVIGLIIAVIQSRQSNKQTLKLKVHGASLELIAESLSTRYIGAFPEYLSYVTSLIDTANVELRIVKGNPTPAYFSAPSVWVNYSQSIERKAHSEVSVSIISMSERQRRMRLAQQFPTSKEKWDGWITENESKVVHFLKFGHSDIKIENLNYATFLDLLLSTQTKMLNESFKLKGVEVQEVDQVIPVQVWIADRKQAVFSIQTLPTNSASHGFITSDPRIVSALHQMTELFIDQKTKNMNIHSRIDTIIVTKDINKSISFYRDEIGLEMRAYSNPVAIFKYDYISIYVYQDSFFKEQFNIEAQEIVANGMLSIEINSINYFKDLKAKLLSNTINHDVISKEKDKIIIRDFNNLIIEFWVIGDNQ